MFVSKLQLLSKYGNIVYRRSSSSFLVEELAAMVVLVILSLVVTLIAMTVVQTGRVKAHAEVAHWTWGISWIVGIVLSLFAFIDHPRDDTARTVLTVLVWCSFLLPAVWVFILTQLKHQYTASRQNLPQ